MSTTRKRIVILLIVLASILTVPVLNHRSSSNRASLLTGPVTTCNPQSVPNEDSEFRVTDYGATGDGITDDTACIQAAVNAAATITGSIVYFPAGTYIVSQVEMQGNVTYQGEGNDVSVIKSIGADSFQQYAPKLVRSQWEAGSGALTGNATTMEFPNDLPLSIKKLFGARGTVFFRNIVQVGWSNLNDRSFIARLIDPRHVVLYEYHYPNLSLTAILNTPGNGVAKGTYTAFTYVRGHNLQDGDKVTFYGLTQKKWLALNGKTFSATVVDDDTFAIDFDSTGFSDFTTSVSGDGIAYKNMDTSGFSSPEFAFTDPGSGVFRQTAYAMFHGVGNSNPASLTIKDLSFDGNITNQGPYKNYEASHQAMIFLYGSKTVGGPQLRADIENCAFRDGTGDGIYFYRNIDATLRNLSMENIFRGGLQLPGDSDKNVKIDVDGLTSSGKENFTGIHAEPDSPTYPTDPVTYPPDYSFHNINLIDGNFTVSVASGNVRGDHMNVNGIFMLGGGTQTYSDSTFKVDEMSRMTLPNVTFDNCDFIITKKRQDVTEAKLQLPIVLRTSYRNPPVAAVTFNNSRFTVDHTPGQSPAADDILTAIEVPADNKTPGHSITFNGGSISSDFQIGISALGGTINVKDTVISASLPIAWGGYQSPGGTELFGSLTLDGVSMDGSEYMKLNGNDARNTLIQKGIRIDQSNNIINSNYASIADNIYAGYRVILGENPPLPTTHCFPGDIYRMKNPIPGQSYEWLCTKPVFNTLSVPDAWQQVSAKAFDFGQTDSPVQDGYMPVLPNSLYNSLQGYGWLKPVQSRDRGPQNGTTESSLLQDMNFGTSKPGTFQVDGLAPGAHYDVTITLGDQYAATTTVIVPMGFGIVVDGNIADVGTLARQYVHKTITVIPNETGQLQFQFNSTAANPLWAVNAMTVRPAVVPDTLYGLHNAPADSTTVDYFIQNNLTPGDIYTVSATLGNIITPDADARYGGVQAVVSANGLLTFAIKRPSTAGPVTLTAEQVEGKTRARGAVTYE